MRSLEQLEKAIATESADPDPRIAAERLIKVGEETLEHWIVAHGGEPTSELREGFRLLALHRQGAKGDASFNACRETCRELAYFYNLVTMQPEIAETPDRVEMMKMICNHLFLFVSGKMQVAELGDFCCSSKPIRLATEPETPVTKEA